MAEWSTIRGQGKAFAFLRDLVGHVGEDCVIWPFSSNHKGYGMLGHEGQTWKAHRLMCILVHGDPPSPKHQASHNCGKGHLGCVNPNHLEWKTNRANQMDRAEHGTMPTRGRPCRILSPEQIAEIRALKGQVAQYDLAKRFGVKPGTIEYWQSHDKPPSRVTDETVRAVRSIGNSQTQAATARQLGIGTNTVHRILKGRAFKSVA